MRKWNKLLALLLAMAMVFGMATTAFAEEATEPAETPAEDAEAPAETPAEDATADETTPAEGEETAPVEETPAEETPVEAGYTDVTEANWFYEAVTYVTENGLVDGETETTFAPSADMTRADMIVALYRMAGSPEVTGENPFTDVAADADYYAAVIWGTSNGVINGTSETTFSPDDSLQRQAFATMLYRYEALLTADETAPADDAAAADETAPADDTATTDETVPAEELTPAEEVPADETGAEDVLAQYADADSIQAYAREAMAWAVTAGLFQGDPDNNLNPRVNATRAEVATLIMRFAEMTAAEEAPEDAIGGADEATDITVTDGEETTETETPAEGEETTETETPAEGEATDETPDETAAAEA